MIYGSNIITGKSKLRKFIEAVVADGGTIEEDGLAYAWNKIPYYIRKNATGWIMPGAYKAGKQYIMKPDGSMTWASISRGTVATRRNKDGNLEDVASNVLPNEYNVNTKECVFVIQGTCTNDIANSHAFTGMVVDNSSSISGSAGVYAGATVRQFDRSSTSSELSFNIATGNVGGFSIFVKSINAASVDLFLESSVKNYYFNFNFTTKAFTANPAGVGTNWFPMYEDFANGWYRIIFQHNLGSAAAIKAGIGGVNGTQAIGTSVLTHSWQYNTGTAHGYIKTTGSAATRGVDSFTLGSFATPGPMGLWGATENTTVFYEMNGVGGTGTPFGVHGTGFGFAAALAPRNISIFNGSGGAINTTTTPYPVRELYYNTLNKFAYRRKDTVLASVAIGGTITNSTVVATQTGEWKQFSTAQTTPGTRYKYLWVAFFNYYVPNPDFAALTT